MMISIIINNTFLDFIVAESNQARLESDTVQEKWGFSFAIHFHIQSQISSILLQPMTCPTHARVMREDCVQDRHK